MILFMLLPEKKLKNMINVLTYCDSHNLSIKNDIFYKLTCPLAFPERPHKYAHTQTHTPSTIWHFWFHIWRKKWQIKVKECWCIQNQTCDTQIIKITLEKKSDTLFVSKYFLRWRLLWDKGNIYCMKNVRRPKPFNLKWVVKIKNYGY